MPDDTIEQRMEVVKKLTELFKFERMVYLGITVVSLLVIISCGIALYIRDQVQFAELSLLFGSSGAITYTAGRLLFIWNEALKRLMPYTEKE